MTASAPNARAAKASSRDARSRSDSIGEDALPGEASCHRRAMGPSWRERSRLDSAMRSASRPAFSTEMQGTSGQPVASCSDGLKGSPAETGRAWRCRTQRRDEGRPASPVSRGYPRPCRRQRIDDRRS